MRPSRIPFRRLPAIVAVLVLSVVTAVVLPASPAAAAVDLATGRPASADSAEAGRPASAANDADPATRWCAADAATGHWWQVDLGSAGSLTGTQVVWEFARDYRYRVAVSTDGSAWTTVADRTATAGTDQTRTDTFGATQGRYVRITVTGLAAGTWACMLGFSVYGTPATQPFKGLAGGDCTQLAKLNVAWYYNWWISPGDCAAPGFVPMISGKGEKTSGDVTWALDQVSDAGYRTVLGFNEPNKADQSNMTVAKVLELWPALTANPSIRVSSPSTSGDGQAWMTDFMTQATARGLRIDFINLHWYGWNAGSCDANAAQFESYLRWAEGLPGNHPIWITEYGCLNQSAPDTATVQRFHTAAVAMLTRHSRVERQAFYPWIGNHDLFTSTGAFTPLGQSFAAMPAYR